MILNADRTPIWRLRLKVESTELWELPRHDGNKTARFIPSQLDITWNYPGWSSGPSLAVELSGRRRRKDGKYGGFSSVGASWYLRSDGEWSEDPCLRHAAAGGQIPGWLRRIVESIVPPELGVYRVELDAGAKR